MFSGLQEMQTLWLGYFSLVAEVVEKTEEIQYYYY